MSSRPGYRQVVVLIDEEIYTAFRGRCRDTGRKMSTVARLLVTEYLAAQGLEQDLVPSASTKPEVIEKGGGGDELYFIVSRASVLDLIKAALMLYRIAIAQSWSDIARDHERSVSMTPAQMLDEAYRWADKVYASGVVQMANTIGLTDDERDQIVREIHVDWPRV